MAGINAVVFDVFETLVPNSVERWQETFGDIVRTQGLAIRPSELYRLWKDLENKFREERINLKEPEKSPPFKSYEHAWRDCFAPIFTARGFSKADPAAAANFCVRDMASRRPFPDALDTIKKVQDHYKVAIISNADNAYLNPIADRLKAAGVKLVGAVSSEKVKAYKPLPGAFTKALDEMGLKANESVYVGDMQWEDVTGGHRAGMKTVWLNKTDAAARSDLPKPDHEITAIADLLKVLDGVKA